MKKNISNIPGEQDQNPTDDLLLSDLKPGEKGLIIKVLGHGAFRKRVTEMGFVKGKIVTVVKNAPLMDPVEYELMGYNISLRKSEARMVIVIPIQEDITIPVNHFNGTTDEEHRFKTLVDKGKFIHVALVGNPNCGKTTLFNHASGSHERVGNYGGVTVESKTASLSKHGYRFDIVDLPGTYSITEYTPEELYVRNHIVEKMPDIVVNIIDASNLERNLYLTTQLIDMNIKVVIALNMFDELEKQDVHFDYEAFGKMIGIPVVPTVASKGKGINELFQKIIDVYEDNDPGVRHIHIHYGEMIETGIKEIQEHVRKNSVITDQFSSRYIAIKLIEKDSATLELLRPMPNFSDIEKTVQKVVKQLEEEFAEPTETIITDAKYGFIDGALRETMKKKKKTHGKVRHLDDILTHRFWGFPIFMFFIFLMFQATFVLGSYPMNWIESGVSLLSEWFRNVMPETAFRDLLVDGIIGGVGGVIIFLPNILILFFFISLMEDSGYMARTAFIMDKLMHLIGLHGKSFIPLIMGFGCNVPAIMATRTLENKSDRLLTMMIIPFMSCSARLPVYILLISAFFPSHQGLILFSIYLIGVLLSIIVAFFMKKVAFSKKEVPFVMELPPYRIPTLKNTGLHMWFKARQYLKKMGTVILVASVIIWALGYFPKNINFSQNYDQMIAQVSQDSLLYETSKSEKIKVIEIQKESERQEKSYIGQIGHLMEPVIAPLGFDWKMGVSIFTGLAAKEIVVSTMGVLYHADLEADENSTSLIKGLQTQVHQSGELKGQKVFTPLVAFGFILFILIYFPCIAVITAVRKESNRKWALILTTYTTVLAWIVSFLVYQIGSLL